MPRAYLFFLSILCWSSLIAGQKYRLPDTIIPSHYDVTLDTDLIKFNFGGSVRITIRASQETNTITLHSRYLELSNLHLVDSSITITDRSVDRETDFLVLNLSENLVVEQDYQLSMDFVGVLNTENVGYYRASYPDEEGNTRYLAITHSGSTNARRVFPCFDQPDFKATFRLHLIRDSTLRTTSNTFRETSVPDIGNPNKKVDTYAVTPLMSTYLLAFSVSDYIKDYHPAKPLYSVYGRRELIQRGEAKYALTIGKRAISALQVYTGIQYSLATMDQLAVPNDHYEIGAMENWGMVTYRECYLMYNKETSTTAEKRTTAMIIAHEFAQQWFGNLVTPQWWKYIWLTEGFATYLGMVVADKLEPEWRLMDHFLISILQPALNADAFLFTTPMTKDAESPSEIESLYGTIVSDKAGSVIRMTQAFLGESVFRAGLTKYLNEWRYKNVEPANLYSSWQETLGDNSLNVSKVLRKWETKEGYPVVTIKRNYHKKTINLKQKRFLLNEPTDKGLVYWPIPLNFMYSKKDNFDFSVTSPDIWFTDSTRVITDASPKSFIIANKGVTGYYRVNYDVTNWNNIIFFLTEKDFTKIPVVNRAQLLDDAFNLARAGELGYEVALQLSTYVTREKEYVPMSSFFNVAKYLDTMLASYNVYPYFRAYIAMLLVTISEELAFDETASDDHHQKLNRINVMNWMCDVSGGECRQKSLDSFRRWKTGEVVSLKPDSQLYAYCGAFRKGDQSDWNFLFEKYQADKSDMHRTRILNALGCSENTQILTRLLDMTLYPGTQFFKTTDRQTAFASVYNSGRIGLDVAFNYVKSKHAEIDASTLSLNTIITELSNKLSTPQQLAEFITMLQTVSDIVPENVRVAAQKNVENNVAWSTTNVPVISAWLREYVGVIVTTTEGSESTERSTEEVTVSSSVKTTTETTSTVETTTPGGTAIILPVELLVLCLLVQLALIMPYCIYNY